MARSIRASQALAVLASAVAVSAGAGAGGARMAAHGAGTETPLAQQAPASGAAVQAPESPRVEEPAGAATPQDPHAVFASGVDLVTLDVSVVDDAGRPVRGLTKDDFALEVNGVERPIASVQFVQQNAAAGAPVNEQYSSNEGAAGGRLIMVVVDQGNIRSGGGQTFLRAAERLFADLGPGDRVGLAVIPGGRLIEFTPHVQLVREALSQSTGGAITFGRSSGALRVGPAEAIAVERTGAQGMRDLIDRECAFGNTPEQRDMCIGELESEARELASHIRQQTANSLLALRQLMTRLASQPRPKTLIMLSEGLILGRGLEDVSWVSALAARAQISLYAILVDDALSDVNTSVARASHSRFEDRRLRIEGLNTLVGLARGTVFLGGANGEAAYARLSLELTGQYLLAFEPTDSERDGRPQEVSVEVKRRGVEVRTRREFVLSPPAGRRTDEDLLAETLRDPLLATDVGVRVATYSLPEPDAGQVRVFVTTGLEPTGDRAVRSIAYALVDGRGQLVSSRVDRVEPRDGSVQRYQTTVGVPPGSYTLKIAVVDDAGGRGSVEHHVRAGLQRAAGLAVGELMLTDLAAHRAGKLRPAIEPAVRVDAVGAYLELLGGDASSFEGLSAMLEIATGADGPALASGPLTLNETSSAARRVAEGEVSLASLAPGAYVARAVVTAGGRPVTRVLRPLTFDPTSETRIKMMTAAAPGAGGTARAAFDRAGVLRAPVLELFLQRAEASASSSRAPAVEQALESARAGKVSELPDVLASSDTADDPLPAFLRGLGLYARGDLEPAAAAFRQALRASMEFTPATFYLGACYAAGGRDREAVGAWQTALASDEPSPVVFTQAVDAYLRLRDWEAARDLATEALDLWPADDDIRLRVVRAYAAGGRVNEALDALDPYLERHADDHESLMLAMRLLYESGASLPARAEADRQRFERYLRLYTAADGPQRALAAEWLKVIEGRAKR